MVADTPSDSTPQRVVLISGPAGSGKTTVCRLGYQAMLDAWGAPTAAIDVDQLYANVDARWELPYDDARNAMVMEQAAQLTLSLHAHGWPTVLVCGNSLFEPADTAPLVQLLGRTAQVHHVTLMPAVNAVLARCAGAADRDPARLRDDVRLLAARPHPGTAGLNNTDLSPQQTLHELVSMVRGGAGRLLPAEGV